MDFINQYKSQLDAICKSLNIKELYVFGSYATGNQSDKSDVDILISFKKDISIEQYTENYFEFQYQIRALFNKDIDVITEGSLKNKYFIDEINKSKKLVYAA